MSNGRLMVFFTAGSLYGEYFEPARSIPAEVAWNRMVRDTQMYTSPGYRHWKWAGVEYVAGRAGTGSRFCAVAIVYPWIVVPLAVATAGAVVIYRRRRFLSRAGVCAKCGYDLRASQDRCPECGTPVPGGNRMKTES